MAIHYLLQRWVSGGGLYTPSFVGIVARMEEIFLKRKHLNLYVTLHFHKNEYSLLAYGYTDG